ncbi:MAG: phosphoribosylformimino-5-aminoimidazole carboxamide ribotide isomerase [Lentisphaeria bacterium]
MKFRPCIDLHYGKVKQIVGSSLSDNRQEAVVVNFESEHPASYFAEMYKTDGLFGGHVIKLGPGNDQVAADALKAYPNGLQIGGGINLENATFWLDQGADKLIVTSYIFQNGKFCPDRLAAMVKKVGRENLVLDLSCRQRDNKYLVVMDRWQTYTDFEITPKNLENLAKSCSEFLVHAVDVEGKQQGIEADLVAILAKYSPISMTYAGGISQKSDLDLLAHAGANRLDFTVGSALDIFGGHGLTYRELVSSYK